MESRVIREGSVGLFALIGLFLIGALVVWLRGDRLNQKGYQLVVTFDDVSGLQLGAPVNYRGVRVGKIGALVPSSNNVSVILEIDDSNLRIPPDVKIQANSYGLIGEAVVDITPKSVLSEQALQIDPNSEECQGKNLILCNQDRLEGRSSSELMSSLTRISESLSDPQLLGNIKTTTANTVILVEKALELSDELSAITQIARQEIEGISKTMASIEGAANQASDLITTLDGAVMDSRNDLQTTIKEASLLVDNLNGVVTDNRSNIQRTILSVEKSSNELQNLVQNLDVTVTQVNEGLDSIDTPEMAQNLEQILAETAQTSANLRQLSDTLNDPATITTLMKTLDSARVTFENTQKITSDVEALIGDPVLMENLRRMINGLSDLVSSTEQLEQQVITLQRLQQETAASSLKLAPFMSQPEITSIDPKTSRYQILSPQARENKPLLTQK
ncbi:MAG: MlaD family protein [Microcystaceae cyanobacterium]